MLKEIKLFIRNELTAVTLQDFKYFGIPRNA